MNQAAELDLIVVGGGPAGIALAAEAKAAGVPRERVLVLEKAPEHSWVIRRYYPASKKVLANYKGIDSKCEGVLCIPDLDREETLSFLDRAIRDSGVRVRYGEEVHRIGTEAEDVLRVETSSGILRARVVVIAIGILGRPNRPSYAVPRTVSHLVLYDVTSEVFRAKDVLVVGGGDTAMEYCQFLVQEGNRVTLSYRGGELSRPNPINRESVLELARQGKLRLRLSSNLTGLEKAGDCVRALFDEPESPPLDFDRIVYALGGTTPDNFLKTAGVAFDGPRPRLTGSSATSVRGLFLAGDLTAGRTGGSIILAFNSAAAVMRQICRDFDICAIHPRSVSE